MAINVFGVDIPQTQWVLIAAPLTSGFYIYFTWNYDTFKKQGIPGPRPIPGLGSILGLIRKGMFQSQLDWLKQYGKIYGTFIGAMPVLNVADPEIVKEILIKRFPQFHDRSKGDVDEYITSKMLTHLKGDHWKRIRTLVTPCFSARKLRVMTWHIQRCNETLIKNLMLKAESGENFEYREYFTWNYDTFKKQGIPGPRPIPGLGSILGLIRKGMFQSQLDWLKQYGKIYGTFIGAMPVLNVADPEIVKEILIKRFPQFHDRSKGDVDEYITSKMLTHLKGDHWKRIRTLVTPCFSARKLRVMTWHIQRCNETLIKNLMLKAESGENFEYREQTGAFTADVIASTGFGLQVDTQKDYNTEFVRYLKEAFNISFKKLSLLLVLICPPLFRFLNRHGIVDAISRDLRNYFDTIITQAIEQRKQTALVQGDFLQIMTNAHLEDPNPDEALENTMLTKDVPGLTHEEVVAQSILLMLAGYETTANTLAFVGYCLATNPDCQQQLIEEIDSVMQGETEPNYDLLKNMPYLDMVLCETMRMYPAVPSTNRMASEDVIVNGLFIPKNMTVAILINALHHDPEAWPQPEQFRPERFTVEEKAKRHPYQWLPFGLGPRHCLGMRLALLEMKMTIVYLMTNFRFKTCEKTQIPIQLKKFRLTAENGLYLKLEKRSDISKTVTT